MKKIPQVESMSEVRVTLLSLARHLGVSKTTVSVVLSEAAAAAAIPPATRQRILEAAREHGYRPHFIASSLRRKSTLSVGVMVPDLGEGYFTLIMDGVQRYLSQTRYFYFTACHYLQPDLILEHARLLTERGVDGLLLINTPTPPNLRVPTVTISGHVTREGVTNVILDHQTAARLALVYLHKLGHRRIAFMRGQTFTLDADDRWNSIVSLATELGLEVDPELLIPLIINSWSPELGYEPVKALLAKRCDFTAIFCFNDISAIGAMRALHEAGLRIPEDVSVVGFDDVASAPFTIPSLTTVRQPLAEMGRIAADLLLSRIADPLRKDPPEIIMAPELVIRESTCAPPSQMKSRLIHPR